MPTVAVTVSTAM